MRNIPETLAVHLNSGATTLCRCWRVSRNDETVQGFTDHDDDIVFDETIFRAGTGFEGTEVEARFGLGATGTEIHGALSAESLNETDLAAGRYDNARIELFLVNWSDATQRILLRTGHLGEVRREGAAFAAEVRGLSHRLAEERGRIFSAACDADLGDARCGVDLDDPAFKGEGTVLSVEGTSLLRAGGLEAFEDGWFTRGKLVFATGANETSAIEVKEHRFESGEVRLSLWQAMPEPIAPGDTFTVTAGCDKRFETCRVKFGNAVNFRGFPHMPGNDFVAAYAVPGEPGNDGSPAR